MTDAEAMMIHDEGERLKMYQDSVGKWTVGIGHNLTDKPISKIASRMIFMDDLADAIDDVHACCACYNTLSRPRQLVLINLAFNVGRTGLSKFVKFLDAIQASLHEDADEFAVPDFHRRIIEERLKQEDENPSEGESWESLRARIERK